MCDRTLTADLRQMTRFSLFLLLLLTTVSTVSAQQANHLLGARSPYLLQHLYNPVDWYPWGPAALEKARAENKLIFVSVGYSSCHWCHVMEDESFENEDIARFLNDHFVSIKIDRESRPDLDEQFMAVTQVLTGTGGWPNSVFLTPAGDPFSAGGYAPPDEFLSVLHQAWSLWQEKPDATTSEARRIARTVSGLLASKAEYRNITPESVQGAVDAVTAQLDDFHGGLGVAPKFPREPLFLFLLDLATRRADRETLQNVTGMLDSMIRGGIHDHVGGGFHRYAVDPEWHVPHFEKMLYTQALTGRLLIRAWDVTRAPEYRRAAERLFDFVLRDMRDPGGAFYAALDADSLNAAGDRVEGAFYTWDHDDFEPLGDTADFARAVFRITPNGNPEGANVLRLPASTDEMAYVWGQDPAEFTANVEDVLRQMRDLRAGRPPPLLDSKILVSWNAAMIETLAEASHLLERPEYYAVARSAAEFIRDNMQTPDGLLRVHFDGVAGTAAQLPDYAGLGLAMIALHDYAPDPATAAAWLAGAQTLADDLRGRFGPAASGFRMTETPDGFSDVTPVNDAGIPGGNALALTFFARLARRAYLPGIERDAVALAGFLSGHAISQPQDRGFALKVIQELQSGPTGPVRYAGKGAVRIEMHRDRVTGRLAFDIALADGWHVNAHHPLEDYFIATELTVEGYPDIDISYPDATIKTLSFNGVPLALYEGRFTVRTGLPAEAGRNPARRVTLTLQACSDNICLQPEDLTFVLW